VCLLFVVCCWCLLFGVCVYFCALLVVCIGLRFTISYLAGCSKFSCFCVGSSLAFALASAFFSGFEDKVFIYLFFSALFIFASLFKHYFLAVGYFLIF